MAAKVRRELERLPESLTRLDLAFHCAIEALDEGRDLNDVEAFDEGLDLLYDWADEHRVWLGVRERGAPV